MKKLILFHARVWRVRGTSAFMRLPTLADHFDQGVVLSRRNAI